MLIPLVALLLPESRPRSASAPLGATSEPPAAPRAANPFTVAIDGLIRGVRSLDFWLLA